METPRHAPTCAVPGCFSVAGVLIARLEHFSYRCRPKNIGGVAFPLRKAIHNSYLLAHSNTKML